MDDTKGTSEITVSGSVKTAGSEAVEYVLIDWVRRIFSSNPFYLASAGFLLYGINRLSSDPRLAGAETSQLRFNFCALFLYEILLVLTSIILARRKIWYDAMLLVGLENLFVLIPFSLVSRTVLLNPELGLVMSCAATFLAVGKFWALKRYLPELNLSRRLLLIGALVMAANVGIALGFHQFEYQRAALATLLKMSWLIGLPLLVGLANLLPRQPGRQPTLNLPWLPQSMLALWIAVTGFHLGGVGYVYGFDWRLALLAPAFWVLAWTVRHRVTDFAEMPSLRLRRVLLFGPIFALLIALSDNRIFLVLSFLSAAFYACIYLRNRREPWAAYLSLVSLVATLASLPGEWAGLLVPEFSRGVWVLYCLGAALICLAAASHDPRSGLLGGILALAATRMVSAQWAGSWNAAIEVGLVFVLLHSLRWLDERNPGARLARIACAAGWILHAVCWMNVDQRSAGLVIYSLAPLLVAFYGLHRFVAGFWASRFLPGAALAVSLVWPSRELVQILQNTSPGFLAVATGFLLFALGTLAALTKHRWNKAVPRLE